MTGVLFWVFMAYDALVVPPYFWVKVALGIATGLFSVVWWFVGRIMRWAAKTGLIVKEADDAISASRYGMMMLRHGRTDAARARFNREIVYPSMGKF